MTNFEQPRISPDFTIDDIHKIREWNAERRKKMTEEEAAADTSQAAKRMMERIELARKKISVRTA